MADELVDIYDEGVRKVGTELKSVAHRTGAWHRSIHCWIVNGSGAGSVLLQKRSATKDLCPGMLDITAAGHYQAGESTEDGVREIVEELGFNVAFERLVPLGIRIELALTDTVRNREFCDTFLLREDRSPDTYQPSVDEVVGLVEIGIQDGLALCAGAADSVVAPGIEFDEHTGRWGPTARRVTLDDLVPRVDPYYYKVFIMADLFLKGYRHLAI